MCNKQIYQIEKVWGTYHAIARIITPQLIAFKNWDKHDYLHSHDDIESWDSTIKKMIEAFELQSKYCTDFTS